MFLIDWTPSFGAASSASHSISAPEFFWLADV